MDTVVTLICNRANPVIDDALKAHVVKAAPEGMTHLRTTDLAPGEACDLYFSGRAGDLKDLSATIRTALAGAPVDAVAQAPASRRKRLLVADMDSTIIGQECIDELAEYAGKRAEISAITERAMRGELDFEAALKERVAMLKGLPETVLEETFRNRITLTPGARTLVRTMKKRGGYAALVSGGFTFFTSRVAEAAGFDFNDANTLIVRNGRLTGEVAEPIRGRAAKEAALLRIVAERAIPPEETMAVGDGANDLSMLARAGLGVAYHAKPAVAEAAAARIDYCDLTALLYLQGIPHTDFSSDFSG
ncbi:MAG: phosphoserine phosphatase SerB [Pseudomonadota bacterium]|nr:phosphoserine phosphatase SerB [Pseudomonadota bacterium]